MTGVWAESISPDLPPRAVGAVKRVASQLCDPPSVEKPNSEMPLEMPLEEKAPSCVSCRQALPSYRGGRPRLYCSVKCRRAEELRLRRARRPVPAWKLNFQKLIEARKAMK